ncbi:MAG: S8 family peptidase [Clostridia bacterium]|nr:S8 family peptidase [Clostridia bacterium]
MKKLKLLLVIIMVLALVFSNAYSHPSSAANNNKKIIVFEESFSDEDEMDALVNAAGGTVERHLSIINAVSAYLPDAALKRLATEKNIKRIENDSIVTMDKKPVPVPTETPPPAPSEVLPWGVDRIGADEVWEQVVNTGVKVAVIDTGIDLDHPDLAANIKGGYNLISPRKTADDDNGHGTHVAGIIAAVDNDFGVVGVGPTLNLYAVKVLDRRGSGTISTVIAGIEWAIANGMDVINMSLGGAGSSSLEEAVVKAYNAGIVLVASAGNSYGGSVGYPAAYPQVIAVSSIDSNDTISSFSSIGPEVDVAAPGGYIYSTYKGGVYAYMSGTSMAAPHVTGAVAVLLTTNGALIPEDVYGIITETVEDLGALGYDTSYGYGLVDVPAMLLAP